MSETDAAAAPRGRAAPSLVDAWIDLVDGLAIPAWVVYTTIGVVVLAIELILGRVAGIESGPFAVYFAVAGVYALALMHHLRHSAEAAFDAFRPSLPPDAPAGTWRTQLTRLPAAWTLVVGVAAPSIAYLVLLRAPLEPQLAAATMPATPAAVAFNLALYGFNWAATAVLLMRIVRQAVAIDRIVRMSSIDLFDQAPLHAFAWLSARSTIGLAILFYAPVLLLAAQGNQVVWTGLRIAVAIVLGAVFVLPLLSAHERLSRERQRLLRRVSKRIQTFYTGLHERLDRGEHEVPDAVRNEIDTLEREQRALRATPTWPWATELISTVMGAIVLPLILSVLLSLVQRVVAG